MTVRSTGLLLTTLAVLVLLGSMLAGLAGSAGEAPPALSTTSGSTIRAEGPLARVEVLNGAGIPGLAREVTERLRRLDFDVKYYGNAGGGPRDSTVVLHRGGDLAAARLVAEALGLDRVETAIDTTLYLDATVILGADWAVIGSDP